MTPFPNGSCSLPGAEIHFHITHGTSDHFKSLLVLNLLRAKNVVWQWTGLSQTMDFSFRAWNNSTWHLTLSMNSHHWALCSSDWAPLWPQALTEVVVGLDPIPGCRLVMYARIVFDQNTRQTVCRLNTAACFPHPHMMSLHLLASEVSRDDSRGVLTVQMSKSFAIAKVQ